MRTLSGYAHNPYMASLVITAPDTTPAITTTTPNTIAAVSTAALITLAEAVTDQAVMDAVWCLNDASLLME